MKENTNDAVGIQRIVKRYKTRFRVPENLDFYSKEDLMVAERKFLKYAIRNGGVALPQPGEAPEIKCRGDILPDFHCSINV